MSEIPRPMPKHLRPLRIVLCRACGQPTGYPGAAFCDRDRPNAIEVLLSDVDHALLNAETNPAGYGVGFMAPDTEHPLGSWVLTTNGAGDTRTRFASLPEALTAHRARFQ